jgi:hypothetical protein
VLPVVATVSVVGVPVTAVSVELAEVGDEFVLESVTELALVVDVEVAVGPLEQLALTNTAAMETVDTSARTLLGARPNALIG